jgi:eukaryotic-like serine/threonine-protein kinase
MFCQRCHRRFGDDYLFCPHDGEKLGDAPDLERLETQPSERTGALIAGRYRVRGLIGQGGMSNVYLCEDQTSRSPVAVKVLASRNLKEPKARARFILEAQAAAKVTHPHIIKMLDVGREEHGAPYIAMEFLFGESLGDWLRREKVMGIESGLPFVRQIAEGLAAAHRVGIVHRDVKPDNIFLLGEKAAPYAVKILDFGLARSEEYSGLTQHGTTMGTIEYMAPEQAVSDAPDARTDVYGLGALMHRMFSGRLPFERQPDELVTLAQQLIEPVPPFYLGTTDIASGLSAVILKALRKRPENRYASMEALIDDLKRLAAAAGGPAGTRDLAARRPIQEPDIYLPKGAFSRNAAKIFYRKLQREAPPEIAAVE